MSLKPRLEFNDAICRWCRTCELICSLLHEGTCSPALSRITLAVNEFSAEASASFCKQCEEPQCLASCPVEGAMTVDERTGAVSIVDSLCVGCGSCATACPYNNEGTVVKPKLAESVYTKCDLCGGKPACVGVCPTGALKLMQIGRA